VEDQVKTWWNFLSGDWLVEDTRAEMMSWSGWKTTGR
jgi:hypothetical protein